VKVHKRKRNKGFDAVITKQLYDGLVLKKQVANKKILIMYNTFEKFIVHILNAPHKSGTQESKKYEVHVTCGPTECNQGVV
jgi:hypothetical protein